MKQIIFAIIAIGFLAISCNQQEDINGKIEASVNQKANRMIDSLKSVCDKNFDTQLQSRVTAAIKANNQLTASPKPTVKPKNKPAVKPKTQTTANKPASKGGRTGIGKGGGLLKKPVVKKPKAKTNTQNNTSTNQPTKTINNRPGVKDKEE